MDAIELLDIIALGETSTVQFKRTMDSPDRSAAELCAFANSAGGILLFGVDDDGTVTGLEAAEVRDISSRVANVAAQRIREPLFPTSEVVKVDEKSVLVVHVSESSSKPHFDSSGAIWVKTMGDKRRVTSREELRRIFQDAHVFSADEQVIPRSSLADFNVEAFDEFYERQYGRRQETESDSLGRLLENLNLARDGHLTLAGLLFFGVDPQRLRPEFATKAVAFYGTDPADTRYRDSEDLHGTLPQQLALGQAFIRRNLVKPQGDQSFNTEGRVQIPDEVLEELLVNMLVHRNYFIAAPQKLFIFADRLELISPGTLPNSLTVEQVKAGNSIPRNPILHGLASKIMPYRGIGTGIRRSLTLYPRIELHNDVEINRFRVVIGLA
ncbi:MAG: putative DNA binding domain-containing protein [Spirochaeta sp.]|jgi:ATP-dependent DNA helicase RecG|nr:putative DNA binding domain-containing protein [Spirochaeta sp.]